MARIRTVKPEVSRHEGLFDLENELGAPVRFAWVMLFTVCDREGRFKWRPRAIKAEILPYDEIDFSRVLDAWLTRGFVVKYRVENEWYGCIPTFRRHQHINNREESSRLPGLCDAVEVMDYTKQPVIDASSTREARVSHAPQGEGKGREGKGREGNKDSCPEQETCPAPPVPVLVPEVVREREAPFITLPLVDKTDFPLSDRQAAEYAELYPAVDVPGELRKMRAWLISNPKQRKTRAGILRFVNAWLAKEQDRGGRGPAAPVTKAQARTAANMTAAQNVLKRLNGHG